MGVRSPLHTQSGGPGLTRRHALLLRVFNLSSAARHRRTHRRGPASMLDTRPVCSRSQPTFNFCTTTAQCVGIHAHMPTHALRHVVTGLVNLHPVLTTFCCCSQVSCHT